MDDGAQPMPGKACRALIAGLMFAMLVPAQSALGASRGGRLNVGRAARVVTLLTGERVIVGSSGGRPTAQILKASRRGPASELATVTMNGDQYVIPASARPYLGRYLDPRLFDVTQLARAGSSGRTALHLAYKPGTVPRLPGVSITSASAGIATGYVTASSARTFGRALATQAIVDSQAGWPRSSKLFGSITAIAPDVPAPTIVTPQFPMVTLIIKVTARSGGPLPFGFGFLMNADNGGAYSAFVFVLHGEARVSVPLGNYFGVFDQGVFHPDGTASFFVMPVTNYQVKGGLQTLNVDARDATASPTVAGPLPTSLNELSLTIDATDEQQSTGWTWGYELGPDASIRLAPAAPTTSGTFDQETRWLLGDPATSGKRYFFDASFLSHGVGGDQSYRIPEVQDLTTIRATYASDRGHRHGAAARFVFLPGSFSASASFLELRMPTRRIEYVSAPTGSRIQDLVASDLRSVWDPAIFSDQIRTIEPGVESQVWLRNPVTLAVPSPGPQDPFSVCAACRSATRMTFAWIPMDAGLTHQEEVFGSPDGSPVVHFAVYRNGVPLLRRRDTFGAIVRVPRGPSTYRVETSFDRVWTAPRLSTDTSSIVTFRSAADSGTPEPPTWHCLTARRCRMLPVLQAFADLHANLHGTVPEHRAVFDVTVGHIAGAADPSISSVRVEVRASGSQTWIALPLSWVSGRSYRVIFRPGHSLQGQTMDLRITASDDAGGRLSQTTSSAFRVSR